MINDIRANELENYRSKRAGILPFTVKDQDFHFLMGIDHLTKEWSDFGGGVKLRENTLEGAIREFKEESNNIFPKKIYSKEYIAKNSLVIFSSELTIVVLYIESKWFGKAESKFFHKKTNMSGTRKGKGGVNNNNTINSSNEKFEENDVNGNTGGGTSGAFKPAHFEMDRLIWIEWKKFKKCVTAREKIWIRIAKFLEDYGTDNLYKNLLKILNCSI